MSTLSVVAGLDEEGIGYCVPGQGFDVAMGGEAHGDLGSDRVVAVAERSSGCTPEVAAAT